MTTSKSTGKASPKTHTVKKGQLAAAHLDTTILKEGEEHQEQTPLATTPSAMANFVAQQLTTPVALTGQRKKDFDASMDKIQKEFGVAVKPVEAKIAKVKVQQNGVTRPAADTKCGQIFAAADEITAKTGHIATIAEVKAACHGINLHTVKTQFARWRAYQGIVGRNDFKSAASKPVAEGNDEGLKPL